MTDKKKEVEIKVEDGPTNGLPVEVEGANPEVKEALEEKLEDHKVLTALEGKIRSDNYKARVSVGGPITEAEHAHRQFLKKKNSGELKEEMENYKKGVIRENLTMLGIQAEDFDKLDRYEEMEKENEDLKKKLADKQDYWTKDRRGFLDRMLGKFASRKLLAFIVVTVAFFMGFLVAQYYMPIVLAYIGSQAVVDIFNRVKLPTVTDAAWGHQSRLIEHPMSTVKPLGVSTTATYTPKVNKAPVVDMSLKNKTFK